MTDPEREKDAGRRGYGNIYTPHAGAMIIHVQRESGLANRMIILSARQVRLLRYGAVAAGLILLSWAYFAVQAARVPVLTRRISTLEKDVQQLDTLKRALAEVEGRFQQVQRMMGASAGSAPAAAAPAAPTESGGLPNEWPLPIAGQLLEAASGAASAGVEIAVPRGTTVRAAGDGTVTEVRDDSLFGRVVRMRHRQGYESVYGNLLDVKVSRGQRVLSGAVIASSGDSTALFPAHLHFEILHDGAQVNPATIVTKGPQHGDLQ